MKFNFKVKSEKTRKENLFASNDGKRAKAWLFKEVNYNEGSGSKIKPRLEDGLNDFES